MEYFITQVLIALPVLGVNVLRAPTSTVAVSESPIEAPSVLEEAVRFVLASRNDGRVAYAIERDGEFTVLAGSQVRQTQNGNGSYVTLRQRLEKDGTIDTSTDPAVMTKNHVFASPSAAAAIVAGRSANGRTAWIEESSGLAYGAWQNRDLEDVAGE